MFIWNFKISNLKIVACLLLIGLVAAGAFLISMSHEEKEMDVRPTNAQAIIYDAKDEAERLSFLSQFGYECDPQCVEVVEVIIPNEFDGVYKEYNALQKTENGLDLEKFTGKRVKRYTYYITNFEGYDGPVIANLLIYKDKVIGGDVCSLALDGFMQGFPR